MGNAINPQKRYWLRGIIFSALIFILFSFITIASCYGYNQKVCDIIAPLTEFRLGLLNAKSFLGINTAFLLTILSYLAIGFLIGLIYGKFRQKKE